MWTVFHRCMVLLYSCCLIGVIFHMFAVVGFSVGTGLASAPAFGTATSTAAAPTFGIVFWTSSSETCK